MSDETKFWVDDPCILVTEPALLPTTKMSKTQKLNSLTLLSIVITVVLYYMGYSFWLNFLLLALLVLIIANYRDSSNKEHFGITPTYLGGEFNQTIVSPTFAEEWQIPPPAYDLYTSVPEQENYTFDEPLLPQSYPYGQVLSTTNLLPSDEYYVRMGCGGTKQAREYTNSATTRHDLAFRENMTKIFKKKLNRRFRHNCQDTFSPFSGY